MENEQFIRDNISSLLSHRRVKSETGETGGEWKLLNDEIVAIHAMPLNIEFTVLLVNEANRCLRVDAKINRKTARLSIVEIQEI